jgi:SAM-dependent methyltransferase
MPQAHDIGTTYRARTGNLTRNCLSFRPSRLDRIAATSSPPIAAGLHAVLTFHGEQDVARGNGSAMTISACRSCGGGDLHIILDLGQHPVSNALLAEDDLLKEESRYPLMVAFCRDCSLLQVTETIPPEHLYQRDYPYFSSSSPALLEHASALARKLAQERNLGPTSFVIEVASNDGYLLKNFVELGVPCLGIDPAAGPGERARARGVPTITDFFGQRLAESLAQQGQFADVFIANNVLAHVDQINDFVAGFARLLKPDGIASFEVAYAVDMIQSCEFDTIYHEHLFYHTLHGLVPLFARHGLFLNDVELLPIHGGSVRIFVGRDAARTARLTRQWEEEERLGVDRDDYYVDFSARVLELKSSLAALLTKEKQNGRRIACYGAAAKGATLLNFLDLGNGFFDFVADANPFKQGKFMPGQRIPIVHPERLLADGPDNVLLLSWNFAGEILHQQDNYRKAGGRFVIPIPKPRIIGPDDRPSDSQFAL